MKIWTNNGFKGFYPVGTAAVVIAETAEEAAAYLDVFLVELSLPESDPKDMVEMEFIDGEVVMLCDGDY